MNRARLTGPRRVREESYHSILAARVRELFRLGMRDHRLVLDKLAARREDSFHGVPALGGTRHTHAAINSGTCAGRVLPV
ncbi:MAG: hypothetical protein WBF43_03420 [Methylocella sp.]